MFIRSRAPLIVLALACALGLAACVAPATAAPETVTPIPLTPTPSATSTSTPVPTLTQTPSLTPTQTVTPGPSPTTAPTPVFGAGTVGDDFLFGNQPPGCVLPCWQGLVVGETDDADIQQVLDTAFGFNGNYDFFEHHWQSDIPGFLLTGYRWDFSAVSPEGLSPDEFDISVWIHEDSQLLEAIHFAGISTRFKRFTGPQRFLKELGVPSAMSVQVIATVDMHQSAASLLIVYDEGIAVYYPYINLPTSRPNNDASGVAELCLGSRPPNEAYYWVEVSLTRPIPGDMNALSPIQKELFGNTIARASSPYIPFEEAFGLSLEEVTKLAQQQQNPCVYTNVP